MRKTWTGAFATPRLRRSSGPFLRAPILSELGIDHGFGTRGSFEAAPARLARAQQVHGVRILEVQAEGQSDEADALFAISPGLAVGVVTADCVPVLLASRRPRPIVVAVHAGWRGSAREIAKSVVEHLQEAQGVWPPSPHCTCVWLLFSSLLSSVPLVVA